jgi:tetratricopeptide (TPR) repeat protein/DNA-binding XRE family transcriptional regulator
MPESSADPSRKEHAFAAKGGRRPGVDVRPGRVKQARLDAGLSLGQVAAGAVSRTAIYYVETGKARPSMETLRLIADRTGRPLDYFLTEPSTMEPRSTARTAELERMLATGDVPAALEAAQAMLDEERDPELAARLKYLMANAHLRLAQAVEGERLASTARRYFEQAGDVLMTAECLGSEASAQYLMQQPGAYVLAKRGLDLCRSLKSVPKITEARLLAVLGGVHATNEEWPAAIECYEQAVAAGEVVQDLRRLSLMYSGLSLAYQEVGQLNQAGNYAQRALMLHETLNDRLSLARSENNLACILVKRGNLADAQAHANRSLALFEDAGVEIGKAQVFLTLCEIWLGRSDLHGALAYAGQGLEVAERCAEPGNIADAHRWLGRVSAALGDNVRADAEFGQALAGLEALGSAERLSRCHLAYAEILEQRGELARANEHLKLAIAGLRPSMAGSQLESRTATA